jgi:hypothetical protein
MNAGDVADKSKSSALNLSVMGESSFVPKNIHVGQHIYHFHIAEWYQHKRKEKLKSSWLLPSAENRSIFRRDL